jgi:hypothetical protein
VIWAWQEYGRSDIPRDHCASMHIEVTIMKPVISVLLAFALASGMGSVLAQSQPAPSQPVSTARTSLRFNDCLRTGLINEWNIVDDTTLVVRTGPYQRYLIKLAARCQWLGIGNSTPIFILNRAEKALGTFRICGDVGEMVRSRDQPPCGIQSVSLIGEDQYDNYRDHSRYHSITTQGPNKNTKP